MRLRDAKNVSTDRFYGLCKDAIGEPDRDRYIAGHDYPGAEDEISSDPEKRAEYLGRIHDIFHLPVTELLKPYGLKTATLCRTLVLSRSTVDNWLLGKSDPPAWVKLLIVQRLDELAEREEIRERTAKMFF